jgi:hypothetical protein
MAAGEANTSFMFPQHSNGRWAHIQLHRILTETARTKVYSGVDTMTGEPAKITQETLDDDSTEGAHLRLWKQHVSRNTRLRQVETITDIWCDSQGCEHCETKSETDVDGPNNSIYYTSPLPLYTFATMR